MKYDIVVQQTFPTCISISHLCIASAHVQHHRIRTIRRHPSHLDVSHAVVNGHKIASPQLLRVDHDMMSDRVSVVSFETCMPGQDFGKIRGGYVIDCAVQQDAVKLNAECAYFFHGFYLHDSHQAKLWLTTPGCLPGYFDNRLRDRNLVGFIPSRNGGGGQERTMWDDAELPEPSHTRLPPRNCTACQFLLSTIQARNMGPRLSQCSGAHSARAQRPTHPGSLRIANNGHVSRFQRGVDEHLPDQSHHVLQRNNKGREPKRARTKRGESTVEQNRL